MSNVEYEQREKEEIAPKVTNPDESRASIEQLLRGLLSANFVSGSSGFQTGSIIIAKDSATGSFERRLIYFSGTRFSEI